MTELPTSDEEFIIERAVEGWEPELIAHALRENEGSPLRDETVIEFLRDDEVQDRIEKEKRLIEKQEQVSREDLIRELKTQMDYIKEQRQRLEGDNDEIGSEETKNLLKAVRTLADLIDVLEDKQQSQSNVVHINKLEQNVNMVEMVEHLPPGDKKSVVKQLEDDPDVEDFVIKRKDE